MVPSVLDPPFIGMGMGEYHSKGCRGSVTTANDWLSALEGNLTMG